MSQVRFLPPQLRQTEGQANWRWHPARTGTSFTALRVRLPLLPLDDMCPWPSGRGSGLPNRRGGFDSRRALSRFDWVGSSAAEQVPVKYQRAGSSPARPSDYYIPGSSLLVVMPGFEPGVRRFDSYPRNFANPSDSWVSLIKHTMRNSCCW